MCGELAEPRQLGPFFGRVFGQFLVFSCSARLVRLSTRTSPSRSRMSPRGAITLYSRVRLFFASARYSSPERTCRFQSRKKRTAKRATATPPSTATRSERRAALGTVVAQVHVPRLPAPSAACRCAGPRVLDEGRPQRAAHAEVDRPAEEEGEDALQEQVADDQGADRRVEAEHQLDRAEAELGEEGQPHAEQRRHQRAVDLEALAEEAGQVADREQDQRAAAERHDQQAVEQEAGREAAHGAGHRAAEQSEETISAGSRSGLTWKSATWEKKARLQVADHAAEHDSRPGGRGCWG